MQFVLGLWLLLASYTLIYWGQYLMRGQHVSLACVALGMNCPAG